MTERRYEGREIGGEDEPTRYGREVLDRFEEDRLVEEPVDDLVDDDDDDDLTDDDDDDLDEDDDL